MDATLPPGWPEEVRPPGAPDWEQTAVAWLFDLVPPDYRAHDVLRQYPVLLARFASDHVGAGLEAARAGWRTGAWSSRAGGRLWPGAAAWRSWASSVPRR